VEDGVAMLFVVSLEGNKLVHQIFLDALTIKVLRTVKEHSPNKIDFLRYSQLRLTILILRFYNFFFFTFCVAGCTTYFDYLIKNKK
jgi:hypothetical protein